MGKIGGQLKHANVVSQKIKTHILASLGKRINVCGKLEGNIWGVN